MKKIYLCLIALLAYGAALSQNEYSEPSNAGSSGSNNTSIGHTAGNSGTNNTMMGYAAGDLVSGSANSFFGANAGRNVTGTNNGLFGYSSGQNITSGSHNLILGTSAGVTFTTASNNVFLGTYAGSSATGGTNTMVGSNAGRQSGSGTGNVFLGYSAGYYETGSNRLYIDNTNTTTPLIFGDFNTNQVSINIAPQSSHALSVGGSLYVSGAIFMNGSPTGSWLNSSNNISYSAGNVSIGTANAQGYKLAVAGRMITEEVVIKLQSAWPDFVFAKDYTLMPLYDLERYINKYHHLPGVPDAPQVASEGIEAGKMNAILLQKIEELTLHIIELRKEIDQLQLKK